MSNVPVYTINLPEYQVDKEPNHEAIGKIIDNEIKKHFLDETLVIRGISSKEHQDKSIDNLIETIKKIGTDRYDPERIGDRYDNIKNKQIDLFAFRRRITPRSKIFKDISWGFYHGAIAIHGQPVRIDILIIYDASQLKAVAHQYEGRVDIKRDGFVFKNPNDKPSAVKAIFRIL